MQDFRLTALDRLSALPIVAGTMRLAGRKPRVRMTPWIPVSVVEGDDCGYDEEHRLTAERLQLLADNFDARVYRPPVVIGDGTCNSHISGELQPPGGWVADVDFDGLHLWMRLLEIVDPDGGRIEKALRNGLLKRSIRFWTTKFEAFKGGWGIRHLAMTGSEVEGNIGLPPLTHYIRDVFGAAAAERLEREVSEPHTFEPYTARTAGEEHTMGKDDPQGGAVTEEGLTALLTRFTQQIRTDLTADLGAALRPVSDQVTTLQSTVATLQAETATLKTDLAAATGASARFEQMERRTRFERELDGLGKDFRLAPGEREEQLDTLMRLAKLDPAAADEQLEVLKKRKPRIPASGMRFLTPTEGAEGEELDDLAVDGGNVDVASATLRTEALKLAGGREVVNKDPQRLITAASRLTGGVPPWMRPN